MSKPVAVIWAEDAEALRARFGAERDPARRLRLQVLWLVREGRGVTTAARTAGVGTRTVERWLGWYRTDGLGEVLRRVPGHGARGAVGWLTPEQQAVLVARCATGAFRTYDEARQWVAAEFGVRYGYQGMYSALARLGVHPKVPRPTAAKADPVAQEAWKKGGSLPRSARRNWPSGMPCSTPTNCG